MENQIVTMDDKIKLLIEKVKTYPDYKLLLAELSGFSVSYVIKILRGERKASMDFVKALLRVSELVDRQYTILDEEVSAAVGCESSDGSLLTQAPAV